MGKDSDCRSAPRSGESAQVRLQEYGATGGAIASVRKRSAVTRARDAGVHSGEGVAQHCEAPKMVGALTR